MPEISKRHGVPDMRCLTLQLSCKTQIPSVGMPSNQSRQKTQSFLELKNVLKTLFFCQITANGAADPVQAQVGPDGGDGVRLPRPPHEHSDVTGGTRDVTG